MTILTRLLASTVLMSTLVLGAPAFAANTLPPGVGQDEQGYYATGRLLIKGKPGLSDNKFLDIIAKKQAKRAGKINGINVNIVDVPPGLEKKIIAELATDPAIDYAELDRAFQPSFVPNDPSFASQWHLSKIAAPAAWDTASANGVTIAILDSGIDATHPDLVNSLVPGWNFFNNTSNVAPVNNHGTVVAGTAGATTNNGIQVAGVAKDAKIMPLRITDDAGAGWGSYMASAISYAVDHGVRVANISYANTYRSSTVIDAANYMRSRGGLVVTSAGNLGIDEQNAPVDAMVIVSATDGNDVRTSWSSFGQMVSVAAPGNGIVTTNSGGGTGSFSGTSVSAPLTAGVIAMMMGANPSLGPTQIQNLLYSTAVDIGTPGKDIYYGYGRVNAAAAVAAAKSAVAADTAAPTTSITTPANNATVNGLVTVNANATDNAGVTKVELFVNGTLLGTDLSAPYSFAWDTTPLGNLAGVNLTAKAYDAAGNVGNSGVVRVNVMNTADTASPVATIHSPTSGAKVSGNVSIQASATDNMAVTSMTILIDGKQVATSTTGSISTNWNTRKASAGTHTILVRATDAAGNMGQTAISVTK